MTDDRIIDIRGFLGESSEKPAEGAFAVWGGEGEQSRFALPVWRAIYQVGGDWGGVVFRPKIDQEDVLHPKRVPADSVGDLSGEPAYPFFVLDLKREPARTVISTKSLTLLAGREVPSLVFSPEGELGILLGEDEERRWFLQVRGGFSEADVGRKTREILLFLAGECAGLLFLRDLATPLPSSASTP